MNTIIDSLSIGNIDDAQLPPPTISAILWTALETKLTPSGDAVVTWIPLREYTEAEAMDLQSGIEWIDRELPNHHILVACRAGMGRSVSMVIAYLCCAKGMSYEDAVAFVRTKRPGATPLPKLEQTIKKVKIRQQAK